MGVSLNSSVQLDYPIDRSPQMNKGISTGCSRNAEGNLNRMHKGCTREHAQGRRGVHLDHPRRQLIVQHEVETPHLVAGLRWQAKAVGKGRSKAGERQWINNEGRPKAKERQPKAKERQPKSKERQ